MTDPLTKFLWCWSCKWKYVIICNEDLNKIPKIKRPKLQKTFDKIVDFEKNAKGTFITSNDIRIKQKLPAEFIEQPDQYKCQKCGKVAVIKTCVNQQMYADQYKNEEAQINRNPSSTDGP